jgi:hypothetical protein
VGRGDRENIKALLRFSPLPARCVGISVCMCKCTRLCKCVNTHWCVCVCVCLCVCVCVCVCVCADSVHTYPRKNSHAQMWCTHTAYTKTLHIPEAEIRARRI